MLIEATGQSEWVCVEILQMSQKEHLFFDLIEHDISGQQVAKTRGMLWSTKAQTIQDRFRTITGYSFDVGMHVRMRVKGSFHPQHGLTLVIQDIVPTADACPKWPNNHLIPMGLSLVDWLSRISDAVSRMAGQPEWVWVEILEISSKRTFYTLVDRNTSGEVMAQVRGMIKPTAIAHIQNRFHTATGETLTAGMRVRMLMTGSFHPQHGLITIIQDIDR
jgi:hypothetical protein